MFGENRFLVWSDGVGNERNGPHGSLHGVKQRQPGEHAGGHLLLVGLEGVPRGNVVRERNLSGSQEVAGEAIPDLQVLFVLDSVPVDRLDGIDQLDLRRRHDSPRSGLPACTPTFFHVAAPNGTDAPARAALAQPVCAHKP